MRRETFSADGPLTVDVSTGAGDLEILPASPGEAVVELRGGPEADYVVELHGSSLSVLPPLKSSGRRRFARTDVKLYVPEHSTVDGRTASGDVAVLAPTAILTVTTASGDVRVSEDVRQDLQVKTASGDVRSHTVGGHMSVTAASGDVSVADVGGDLSFNTASGDLRAGSVSGSVEVRTVSGDAAIDALYGGSVRMRSVSGELRIGIPPGRIVDLEMDTMSGTVVNRIAKTARNDSSRSPLAISLKTVSGDLILNSAPAH